MISLSPNSHRHSGSRRSSGFLRTYILLLLPRIFISSLTLDQFSRTFHVNFCLQNRFRRSWCTWEMMIRWKITRLLYSSLQSLHLTALLNAKHPVMLVYLLIFMFVICCLSHKINNLEVLFLLTLTTPLVFYGIPFVHLFKKL